MALEKLRAVWERKVFGFAGKMTWLSPTLVTLVTLPVGIFAAWLMASAGSDNTGGWILLAAAAAVGICQLLDGFDGTLARATNRVTRFGDLLDHTIDRILDIVWLVAIGMNVAWVGDESLGWLAAVLTLFGSYMGTQAQAVTGSRDYSGFSRADRMALMILALAVSGTMALTGNEMSGTLFAPWSGVPLNPLSILLVICAVGGLYTFIRRFMQAKGQLAILDEQKPLSVSEGDTAVDADVR
jgi:phosphatidylglycerophosphate synthase